MKKFLSMTMILTLAAASLAGCSGGGSSNSTATQQTTAVSATTVQATTTAATTAQPATEQPTTVAEKEVNAVDYLGRSLDSIYEEFGTDCEKAYVASSGLTNYFNYPDTDIPYTFGYLPDETTVSYIYIFSPSSSSVKLCDDLYSDMIYSKLSDLQLSGLTVETAHLEIDDTDVINFTAAGKYVISFSWSSGSGKSGAADKICISKLSETSDSQSSEVSENSESSQISDVQVDENDDYSTEEFKSYLTDGKWSCVYLTDLDGNSETIITHHGTFILQTGAYIKFENDGTFNCCMGNDGASGTYTVSGTTVTYQINTLYTGRGSESINKTYQASFSDVYSKSDKKTYEAISLSFQDGYIHYFSHQ